MLGEINQTPRDKNYIPLIHAIEEKSSKIQRTDWVASGGGGGTGGSRGGNSSSRAPLSLCKIEMRQIYHKTQSNLHCLEQWGSLSLNRGHLTKLGGFSGFHKGRDLGGGVATGISTVEPRDAAKHPIRRGQPLPQRII